jgi:energy-converting hydrogenase B subunit D
MIPAFDVIQLLLLAGIIGAAGTALKSKDLITSVIVLAVMSLLMSFEFYLLQAPDVAIAEAAIGAGMTTAIYIIAINKTNRWEDARKGD